MSRPTTIILSVILAALMAACSASETAAPSGDPAKGKLLFQTGGASEVPCATCHSLDGSALVGPTLQGIAARAKDRVAGLSAEDYLRQSIEKPSAYLVDGFSDQMYKKYTEDLSPDEVNDLVAYLMTQ
jgi:cytochrome c oxidase subunit II